MANIESKFIIKDQATPILDRIARNAVKTGTQMSTAFRLGQQAVGQMRTGMNEFSTAAIRGASSSEQWAYRMEAFGTMGVASLNMVKAAAYGTRAALGGLGIALDAVVQLMKMASSSFRYMTQNLASLGNMISGISSALKDLYTTGDIQRSAEFRIGVLGEGEINTMDIRDKLSRAALESYTSLQDISSLTSGIVLSGATSGDINRSIGLAETISKAMVATGATAEESRRSTLQLKQALSSGILQGDELRSIREQTPGVMLALAAGIREMAKAGEIESKYANIGIGDLKALGREGVLTSQVVTRAFEEGTDVVDKLFAQMPVTFERITTTMKTLISNIWTRITDPNTVFGNIIRGALQSLQRLSNSIINAREETDAFFKGVNEGMAPVYAAFTYIDDAINNFIDSVKGGQEALDELENTGIVFGSVISGILGLLAFKMITFTATTLAASLPILMVVGAVIGLASAMSYCTEGAVTFRGVMVSAARIIVIALTTVGEVALTLWSVIKTVFYAIKGAVLGIVGFFEGLAGAFVGFIGILLDGIGTMVNKVAVKVANLLEPIKDVLDFLGINIDYDALRNAGSTWGDSWKSTAEDLFVSAGDLWKDAGDDWFSDIPTIWRDYADSANALLDWGESAYDEMPGKVDNLMDKIEGISKKSGQDLQGLFNDFFGDTNNSLQSIDKNTANKTVDLSKEDIDYLRSIAARDFMITVNTEAPVVNNTFGDVRETADVEDILDTITDMVQKQLTVSLVG